MALSCQRDEVTEALLRRTQHVGREHLGLLGCRKPIEVRQQSVILPLADQRGAPLRFGEPHQCIQTLRAAVAFIAASACDD
ncbi:hypothetical protein GCM10010344_01630 [Streptomyces bluensis]|nr:hypothetical protein GCM10010344_01630 [Streptomyces bluensis]